MSARAAGSSARRACAAAAAACLWAAAPAAGAEFRSVASAAAVMYDAPSQQARKLFVAPRGMPVEVLSVVNQWVKVREMEGALVWVERADLSAARTVICKVAAAAVRAAPQEGGDVVFQAERGVVLELTEPAPAPGWVRVRHRDGATGYVRAVDVWGL